MRRRPCLIGLLIFALVDFMQRMAKVKAENPALR